MAPQAWPAWQRLGGFDIGAFALAEAVLLNGYRANVQWESATTFHEVYPTVAVAEQLYAIDRDRNTRTGGHATLDMMLNLIARRDGEGNTFE